MGVGYLDPQCICQTGVICAHLVTQINCNSEVKFSKVETLLQWESVGRNMVKNPSKSGQKRPNFAWSVFQIVGTMAIA